MIEFKGVSIRFDGRWVLKDFCASIGKGVTLLDGDSGSGKSTVIGILLGLTEPTSGEVIYPSGTVFSYCGPRPSLFYEKPFGYSLKRLLGIERVPERLEPLIKKMNASSLLNRIPNQLSGGERRKLEIAFCLAKMADVYILDEPLSGLDRVSKEAVVSYLGEHGEEAAFLLVNHDKTIEIRAKQTIALGEGGYSVTGSAVSFEAQGYKNKGRVGLRACVGHLFRTQRLFCLLEWVLFSLLCLASFSSIALLPPSDEAANERIVAADPSPAFLFTGDPDSLTFESFADRLAESSLLALPLVEETPDHYQSSNGFLLPYEGDDFLVLQNCSDGFGFNLRSDYAYSSMGERIEGQFSFIAADDPVLDPLRPYAAFASVLSGEAGAILLCPEDRFGDVVISLANGDFQADNYLEIDGGDVSLPSPRLAELGYMPGLNSLVFEPGWNKIPVVPGDSFWLSLPDSYLASTVFGSPNFLPCEQGEPAVSLAAYLYLCSFGEGMNQLSDNSPLLYLGLDREAALSIDLTGLTPGFTVLYSPESLQTARTGLLYSSLGLGIVFLAIFGLSFLNYRRYDSRTKEILILNGVDGAKTRLCVGFSYFLVPLCLFVAAFALYLVCLLPCFNWLQAALDYPQGYADSVPMMVDVGPIAFYAFSAYSLLFLLYPLLYLLHFVSSRRKRR